MYELTGEYFLSACYLFGWIMEFYMRKWVAVYTPLSREVFWHEYAKIPRHTSQNSIAAGNLE